MQPFLRQYRASLRLKTIFGLCPFVVAADDKFVRLSAISTICTTIVVVTITLAYPYLTWQTLDTMVFDALSGTRAITAMLEHIIVAGVFLAIQIASLVNREQHTRFLNSFAALFDRWLSSASSIKHDRRDIRRLFVKNGILYAIYFLCNVLLIFLIWTELADWEHVVYNLLYIFAMLTELQAVFHVRDFAMLLGDAFAECAFGANVEATFLSDLEDVKCAFDECFGVYLLLFQLKDFLFLTSVVFFAVVEFFFAKEGYTWTLICFMAAFYVPVLAKNVWLVRTIDGMEQNILRLQEKLVTARMGQDSREMLLHQNLHFQLKRQTTAAGFFPYNMSLLFSLLSAMVTYLLILLQFQLWEENNEEFDNSVELNGTNMYSRLAHS